MRPVSFALFATAVLLAVVVGTSDWFAPVDAGVSPVTGFAAASSSRTTSAVSPSADYVDGKGNKRFFVRTAYAGYKKRLLALNYRVMQVFSSGFSVQIRPTQETAFRNAIANAKKEFAGQPAVSIEPVGFLHFAGTPSPTVAAPAVRLAAVIPWNVQLVKGGTGDYSSMTVAVIDSGVKKDHIDLNVKGCFDLTGSEVVLGCVDTHGHGTHVAGIIAANGGKNRNGVIVTPSPYMLPVHAPYPPLLGVAPNAAIWAYKVCLDYDDPAFKTRGDCPADAIAKAIELAAKSGVNVIQMSLGKKTEEPLIRDAVQFASKYDVMLVASSGNDGSSKIREYPSSYKEVVSVGAVDGRLIVADFSNPGVVQPDSFYQREDGELDFVAPGVDILSTSRDGMYETKSGTSMAAPHISGLALRYWRPPTTKTSKDSAIRTRKYMWVLAMNRNPRRPGGKDAKTGFGFPVPLDPTPKPR